MLLNYNLFYLFKQSKLSQPLKHEIDQQLILYKLDLPKDSQNLPFNLTSISYSFLDNAVITKFKDFI